MKLLLEIGTEGGNQNGEKWQMVKLPVGKYGCVVFRQTSNCTLDSPISNSPLTETVKLDLMKIGCNYIRITLTITGYR